MATKRVNGYILRNIVLKEPVRDVMDKQLNGWADKSDTDVWEEDFKMMEKNIGYCGLDCSKCDAMLATLNNDDELREKTAQKWSELNGIEITKDMINCTGCKSDGIKTYFCEQMCNIRKCAADKDLEICSTCAECGKCENLKMITDNSKEAADNIEKYKEDEAEISTWLPIGMCLGLGVGTAIGSALNNIGVWMPIGICFGIIFGVIMSTLIKQKK